MQINAGFNLDITQIDSTYIDGNKLALNQGDKVQATVVENKDGNVVLKTSDGNIIKAKLQEDVVLEVGVRATLTVTGKQDETVYMSVSSREVSDFKQPTSELTQLLNDQSISNLVQQLQDMKLPITKEIIENMIDMLNQYPEMTLEKAAFFAANNIPADSQLILAADQMLNQTPDIATLMGKLVDDLNSQSMEESKLPQDTLQQNLTQTPQQTNHPNQISLPAQSMGPNTQTLKSDFIDWLNMVAQSVAKAEKQSGDTQSTKPSISENGTPQVQTQDTAPLPNSTHGSINQSLNTEQDMVKTQITQQGQHAPDISHGAEQQKIEKAVFELLLQMLAMQDTSQKGVNTIAKALVATMEEINQLNSAQNETQTQILIKLLKNIVVQVGDDPQLAQKLQKAKDELTVRLALFEQVLESSNITQKQSLIQQTQNIVDQTRLMSNIEQFVYVQLPIQINNEQKNADLYV